jgi:hypothetical protein
MRGLATRAADRDLREEVAMDVSVWSELLRELIREGGAKRFPLAIAGAIGGVLVDGSLLVLGLADLSGSWFLLIGLLFIFVLLGGCLDLLSTLGVFKHKLARPPVAVVTKREYGRLLKEWNESGPGTLLLYNIELQSFTDDQIDKTWGGLAKLENIQSVVLLLPEVKVHRWERVVFRERSNFFAEGGLNREMFKVCQVAARGDEDPKQPRGVAFALYRLGDDPGEGTLHKKAVVFVLSQPFSALRDPLVREDRRWWDYHHVMVFDADDGVIDNCREIWSDNFDATRMRDVNRVIQDFEPLRPIGPAVLFEKLRVDPQRRAELLPHFQPRTMKFRAPDEIDGERPDGQFRIVYDNTETIEGHYSGAAPQCRKGLIWVGGFTEKWNTKLPKLFERVLKREDVVQFYYEVSPPIEFITLTRYQQDMREVLKYVNEQEGVIEHNKLILIARSINGLIAASVLRERDFLQMLGGVILVAPVFDVMEMIDNYRAGSGQDHVRVENCWRVSPGYSAYRWESPKTGWLEFFRHQVSLTLMADIIRNDPDAFSLEAFVQAVGAISHHCPVYVLSHPEDPITGSERALKRLENAASGTGLIENRNYHFVPIHSSHLPPARIEKGAYPFELRGEVESVHKRLRAILRTLGVPTLSEQETLDASSVSAGRQDETGPV